MDLERNAAILEKTDQAIAAKVRGSGQAALGRLTTDQRVTSAAQVRPEKTKIFLANNISFYVPCPRCCWRPATPSRTPR